MEYKIHMEVIILPIIKQLVSNINKEDKVSTEKR